MSNSDLPAEWNNEAYVSLHLVQKMLDVAGLPSEGWHPQFVVAVPKGEHFTEKRADFFIEDISRNIGFIVEVKSAKSRIGDAARFQLKMYLEHGQIRYGILIDPFGLEIYEYLAGKATLKDQYQITDPRYVEPAAVFLDLFLERIKMRTIAVYAAKGGVGKTTLAINIAFELAKQGKRVLVVDLDDQANASLSLGVNYAEAFDKATNLKQIDEILSAFEGRVEVIDFLRYCKNDGFVAQNYVLVSPLNRYLSHGGKLHVLPSSFRTKAGQIADLSIKHKLLNVGLQKLTGDYDYVIIDTPPSQHDFIANSLYAAQYLLIPAQMEYLSFYGIIHPLDFAKDIRQDTDGKRAQILGIVPTMVGGTKLNNAIEDLVKDKFKAIHVFPGIKQSTVIGQASHKRLPLAIYAEQHKPAQAVAQQLATLTNQLIEQIDLLESKTGV